MLTPSPLSTSGQLTAVPANHTHLTVVVGGAGSVRGAMTQWGDILLRWSGGGKTRSLREGLKGSDPGLRSLSYYTDNGAYYYYQVRDM